MLILFLQDSESDADDGLDDLEKHLREKALRSMRKAQLSPSQMSWKHCFHVINLVQL